MVDVGIFSHEFVLNALMVNIIMGLLFSYLGVHVVGRGIVFVDLPPDRSRCSVWHLQTTWKRTLP